MHTFLSVAVVVSVKRVACSYAVFRSLLPAAVNRFTAAFKFWGFLLAAAEFWGRTWTPWQLHCKKLYTLFKNLENLCAGATNRVRPQQKWNQRLPAGIPALRLLEQHRHWFLCWRFCL